MADDRGAGDLASLRAHNRRRVVDQLRHHGVLSQAEIRRLTGLSRTTVSNVVAELRRAALVVDTEAGRPGTGSTNGRPPVFLALDDSAGAAVGIDFGKSHVRVAVANLAHAVLAECHREMKVDRDAAASMDVAAHLVTEALDQARIPRSRVVGVGMGLPGPVDRRKGMVGSASILPGWFGVRAAQEMGARLELPVELDNDANLGALAETVWGAGAGSDHVAYIKASTGIGCGLVIDGKPYRGFTGTAGEIGHMVVDESGLICYCGNRGCLETLVGGPAVTELLRRSHEEPLRLSEVIQRAGEGDLGCQRALADVGQQIGIAVANLCNLLNPERVVIGGALSLAGDLVLQPVRDAVRRHTIQASAQAVQIVAGVLGDRAEVLGAVAQVLRRGQSPFSTGL